MALDSDRAPVTRERILDTAFALADQGGLEALSMRRIGKALGVEGMALYNHVANKDEILDGIVERVLAEIPLPAEDGDWKDEMRERAIGARRVFLRHPWAIGLLEARYADSSPTRLGYYDAVLGCLRAAGFTPTVSMRAFSIIDSFLYGFVLQELSLPFDDPDSLEEVGEDLLRQMADAYPNLTEATVQALADGWDYSEQFRYGLDLILDALAQLDKGNHRGKKE
ncbi:MAG: TetR/AcrR family transcriptional regulator [Acidimicrobiia bacterium]|nr:TetR/AcrR family transcriptional regulator [Acidimicrobiia bacterium]